MLEVNEHVLLTPPFRALRKPAGDCFQKSAAHAAAEAPNPEDKGSHDSVPAWGPPQRPVLRGAPLALPHDTAPKLRARGVRAGPAALPGAPHGPLDTKSRGVKEGDEARPAGRVSGADPAADAAPASMDVDGGDAGGADRAVVGHLGGRLLGQETPASIGGGQLPGAAGGESALEPIANGRSVRHASGTRASGEEDSDGGRAADALAEAWREDAAVGPVLRGVQEVFGDALLPYAPVPAIAGLFL